MYFIYVGSVAYKAMNVLRARSFANSVYRDCNPINFFLRNKIFFTDRKSLKMQIFPSHGVYDSRVVTKMKQCQCKNAPSYHTSHIDSSGLTFIMLLLGSITIFCMTEKLSHYIQEGGRRVKNRRGDKFPLAGLMFLCVHGLRSFYSIKLVRQFLVPDRMWTFRYTVRHFYTL